MTSTMRPYCHPMRQSKTRKPTAGQWGIAALSATIAAAGSIAIGTGIAAVFGLA
jgi:hypothetical protein